MHEREQARRGQRAAQHATLQPRPAFAAASAAHRFLLRPWHLTGCVAPRRRGASTRRGWPRRCWSRQVRRSRLGLRHARPHCGRRPAPRAPPPARRALHAQFFDAPRRAQVPPRRWSVPLRISAALASPAASKPPALAGELWRRRRARKQRPRRLGEGISEARVGFLCASEPATRSTARGAAAVQLESYRGTRVCRLAHKKLQRTQRRSCNYHHFSYRLLW